MHNERIVSFPHMGNYHIPISNLISNTLNVKVLIAPPITKRTIELGVKHSPDFVCVPFKYNLGNFIEALENGANTLFHAGGGCRFGYYAEIQEQILKDLGYNFEFFSLVDTDNVNAKSYFKEFRVINPDLTLTQFVTAFQLAYEQVQAIDTIEEYVRKNIGFEVNAGAFEKTLKVFLRELKETKTKKEVKDLAKWYKALFKNIPVAKPQNPLRIGIVGELYILMEPFSSYFIEKELAKKGIEVTRYITVSYLLFSKEHNMKKLIKKAYPYLKYEIGADGTDSVARAKEFAVQNYDGIIHLKPFGCTPEVNSMPMLQNIGNDYKIPILYFSFDSQTSETGIKTRMEALYDMLTMRREKRKNA